jgi:hypothetical protein
LIGEGTVNKIEKINPRIAWSHYSEQIFLNEVDYGQYVSWSSIENRNRQNSEITVFVLKNLRKYNQPNQLAHGISPSGYYLTNEAYDKISK